MEESKILQNSINCFIEERLKQNDIRIKNSKEYKDVLKRYLELSNKLEKRFIEDIELWEEYQQVKSELEIIELKYAYKTGFRDYRTIFLNKVEK